MISGFYPTEHFLYRCWERGISHETLLKVLRRVKVLKGRYVVLATAGELSKLGCKLPSEAEGSPLCIVADHRRLQTAYWLCEPDKRVKTYQLIVQVI